MRQKAWKSAPQVSRRIITSSRGEKAGIIARGAGVIAPVAAASPVAGALDPPNAATACWHGADKAALCCCRQLRASAPPGVTLEHCAMKSRWQADFTALRCACVGWCAGMPAAGAGVVAAVFAGAAGAGSADVDLGLTFTADTAFLQPAESVALCCCKQVSASMPPGVTPEHLAMKSERHSALIAFFCSSVGACAEAIPARNTIAQNAGNAEIAD
ncbi:UNVERIFIED_ORG: hypothetical protein GGE63_006200 [Rhizobium esperanzae]